MKIIIVDNFNRDSLPDQKTGHTNLNQSEAEEIADSLNSMHSGPRAQLFYKVVDDDYQLYEGES